MTERTLASGVTVLRIRRFSSCGSSDASTHATSGSNTGGQVLGALRVGAILP
jgi:hypothetical protein